MIETVWRMMESVGRVLEHTAPLVTLAWWLARKHRQSRQAELKAITDKADASIATVQLIRDNDMKHMDAKLDVVQSTAERIEGAVQANTKKLDDHIEWHLNHPVGG